VCKATVYGHEIKPRAMPERNAASSRISVSVFRIASLLKLAVEKANNQPGQQIQGGIFLNFFRHSTRAKK